MSIEKLAFSVKEVSNLIGLSPGKIRKMIRQGELRGVKLGKRVVISKSAIEELLEEAPKCAKR
jgi:excisionase family DNA binding protein